MVSEPYPLPFREGLGVGCSFFLDAHFGDSGALAADVDAGGEVAINAYTLEVEEFHGSVSINSHTFYAGNLGAGAE